MVVIWVNKNNNDSNNDNDNGNSGNNNTIVELRSYKCFVELKEIQRLTEALQEKLIQAILLPIVVDGLIVLKYC